MAETVPRPESATPTVRIEQLHIRMPVGAHPARLAETVGAELAAALPSSGIRGELSHVRARVVRRPGMTASPEDLADSIVTAVVDSRGGRAR
jgi:hypothetical protein